jgi:hypothetical protein
MKGNTSIRYMPISNFKGMIKFMEKWIVLLITISSLFIINDALAKDTPSTFPALQKEQKAVIVYQANKEKIQKLKGTPPYNAAEVKGRGGEIKYQELMTYGAYLDAMDGFLNYISNEISKDRLIWVIQIYHKDGIEHPRAGTIKNCLVTSIIDAETGDHHSTDYMDIVNHKGRVKKFF